MNSNSGTFTFGLAKGVSVHIHEGKVHLVRNYPLKVLSLHLSWQTVFSELKTGRSLSLADMMVRVPQARPDRLVAFIKDLEHHNFLQADSRPPLTRLPSVAVIIPVRNRPDDIQACLRSLTDLDYPDNLIEIIVVDDASEDETAQAARRYPVKVIALKEHRQASFCRNLAARRTKKEVLAFIDSDCLAHPLWLRELVGAFDDPDVTALGGQVDAYYEDKFLDLYERAKSSLKVSTHARRTADNDPFFYVPACNFLIRREAFLRLGGFDENLSVGEDVDLCWRLQRQGYVLQYFPRGTVYHKHRNTLHPFCRRRFEYGTSEPLLQKLHPEKNKQVLLPVRAALFWICLLAGLWAGRPLIGALGVLVMIIDVVLQRRKLGRLPVTLRALGAAVARGYGAALVHWCAFFSRYYLVWALMVLPLAPLISIAVAGMHLINGGVEYHKSKPRLNFPVFFYYFTMEQLSYQSGVWWGCLRYRRMMAVNPAISFGGI